MANAGGDRSDWGKWFTGILGTVLAGVLLFAITRPGSPINHVKTTTTPPTEIADKGGDVVEAKLSIARPCCTFSVQVAITGFRGETCQLQWSVVDAAGRQFPHREGLSFVPEAKVDKARADATVSITTPGTYYIRFILYDPHGVELDRLDTEPFSVR